MLATAAFVLLGAGYLVVAEVLVPSLAARVNSPADVKPVLELGFFFLTVMLVLGVMLWNVFRNPNGR